MSGLKANVEAELGMSKRAVYFVSDGTGFTARAMGRSLLSQFALEWEGHLLPDCAEPGVLELCIADFAKNPSAEPPIVFATLIDPLALQRLRAANCILIDLMAQPLQELSATLHLERQARRGRTHGMENQSSYDARMDAVQFALNMDDGIRPERYEHADLVLTGVSRVGKTPTAMYLAIQFGLRVANDPLIPEDLTSEQLPERLLRVRERVVGLTIEPPRLQAVRQARRPDSRYAALDTCQQELRAASAQFLRAGIPVFDTSRHSIEELAAAILHVRDPRGVI
jgi:regulator of PEP synthase PpsR (kinase-PPPase family)